MFVRSLGVWHRAQSGPFQVVRRCYQVLQTACCRGSGGVAKTGLDLYWEGAKLPAPLFCCKNRYTVTPTLKTQGKVNKKVNICEKRWFFQWSMTLLYVILSWPLLPDGSRLSKCLPDVSQTYVRCLGKLPLALAACPLPFAHAASPLPLARAPCLAPRPCLFLPVPLPLAQA